MLAIKYSIPDLKTFQRINNKQNPGRFSCWSFGIPSLKILITVNMVSLNKYLLSYPYFGTFLYMWSLNMVSDYQIHLEILENYDKIYNKHEKMQRKEKFQAFSHNYAFCQTFLRLRGIYRLISGTFIKDLHAK